MSSALVVDDWLGGLLGRPAYHLAADADPGLVLPSPAFVDAKVAAGAIERVHALAGCGFDLIDTNVRLERKPGDLHVPAADAVIRPAQPADADVVATIAGESFRFDRFHADPKIPTAVADRIKASWAGNFFRGLRGDRMIVAAADHVLGFLQILDRPDHSIIDLIAVEEGAQGRGIAGAMIALAIRQGGRVPWIVGTQVSNIPSLRLYERLGFRVAASQYVFHCHIG